MASWTSEPMSAAVAASCIAAERTRASQYSSDSSVCLGFATAARAARSIFQFASAGLSSTPITLVTLGSRPSLRASASVVARVPSPSFLSISCCGCPSRVYQWADGIWRCIRMATGKSS